MGLLFPEDPHYNENERQTGFYRYRQLLSNRFGQWWKINLLTLVGFAPLAAGLLLIEVPPNCQFRSLYYTQLLQRNISLFILIARLTQYPQWEQ